jgi:hypothetical protein
MCGFWQSLPTNTSPDGDRSTPRGLHKPKWVKVPRKTGGASAKMRAKPEP